MKNKLKRIAQVLLCCFLLIVWSCETEKLVTDEQTPQSKSILSAKTWFDKYESNGINYELFQNLEYDWSEANITKSEDGTETIIVPVIELKEDKEEIWSQKLYLYKLDEGNFKALLFEIYPDKDVLASSQTIDGGDFNGYMTTWDLKMGFVRASRFKNNQVIENGIVTVISIDKNSTSKAPAILPCDIDGCENGNGGTGDPAAPRPPVQLRPVVVTGSSTGAPVIYTPRTPATGGGGTSPGGFTSPGGGSGGSGSSDSNPPVTVTVDPSFDKNPCLKAVYTKLGGSVVFQNYLKKFDGTFSVANLKLEASSTLPSKINAETSPPKNYMISITFNSNNLGRPSLDVARTFIHEMIHAEMFRKLLSLSASNGEIDVTKLNQMLTEHNYPGLYDYYSRFGVNGMQHEQMASHYRETIVSYLKAYDSSLTQEEYESIAWEGLKETTTWNALSQTQKQKIADVYKQWLSKAGKACN
ncbi:hypothetical protein OA88_08140 [Flavobacterium sp. JRM]|nr:hypothetical protein OA88_08140 [Flavobacterium sp. JRM]